MHLIKIVQLKNDIEILVGQMVFKLQIKTVKMLFLVFKLQIKTVKMLFLDQ